MSIDDFTKQGAEEETVNTGTVPSAQVEVVERRFEIPEFLKAKTGSGSVEDYIEHPMNLKKDEHFARVLRGLTGMFNSLDYAIIDVVVGALGYMKKKPKIEV